MSSYVSELRYGLLLSAASFLWVCLEYAAGLHTTRIAYHPTITNFFAIIPIYIIYRAITHRRDKILGGKITWGQGILSGMAVSAVASALSFPVQWLFLTFVNPGFFAAMIEYAVSTGKATQADAERYFSMKSYAVQSVIFPLVAGLITSIIITAIARRRGAPKGESPPS